MPAFSPFANELPWALSSQRESFDLFTLFSSLRADAIPEIELENYKFLKFSQKKSQKEEQKKFPVPQEWRKAAPACGTTWS